MKYFAVAGILLIAATAVIGEIAAQVHCADGHCAVGGGGQAACEGCCISNDCWYGTCNGYKCACSFCKMDGIMAVWKALLNDKRPAKQQPET